MSPGTIPRDLHVFSWQEGDTKLLAECGRLVTGPEGSEVGSKAQEKHAEMTEKKEQTGGHLKCVITR